MIDLERTPDGDINNCALANLDEETNCQVCHGTCPDRLRLSKLEKWLASQAQATLDEHVRPEIQALAKRGDITPAEVAEIRCNSWEWEHLIPAMNDEAFVAQMEHAVKNCSLHKQPSSSYDEAVQGLYAPELLRRFKLATQINEAVREALGRKCLLMANDVAVIVKALKWYASRVDGTRAKVALALVRQQTVSTTCDDCGRKLILVLANRPEDEAPATFCAECGGGCTAMPREEVLSE